MIFESEFPFSTLTTLRSIYLTGTECDAGGGRQGGGCVCGFRPLPSPSYNSSRRAEVKRKKKLIKLRDAVENLMPTIADIRELASEAGDFEEVKRLVAALGGRP